MISDPQRESAENYKGGNLIFIVGASRSGTTWLQRLLATHPRVHTGQEPCVFRSYVAPQLRAWRWELARERDQATATGRGGIGLSCYFQDHEFLAVLREYMCRLLRPMTGDLKAGDFFLDKTPSNTLCLGEIFELLPESRFIHLVRDPRDVVASLLTASRGWGVGWAPREAKAAVKVWIRAVRAAHDAAKNIPQRLFLEVRYERLVAAPESTMVDIARFLNLEWDRDAIKKAVADNQAELVKAGGGTPIPVYGEVARRIGDVVRDPPAFIQNAKNGGWKRNLSLREKFVVWRKAKALMRQMGYDWSWRDWMGGGSP
ncbi:MAG: sulfotransferase family protein [Candidatus Binatia bacterium]